jgi:hypothetical protein
MPLEEEIWLPVPEYEQEYQVSSLGRIKSLPRRGAWHPKISSGHGIVSGYPIISLWKEGKGRNEYIHRLVALAFIENPLNHPQVNHKDGNKTNNLLSNLEWVSVSENAIHAYRILNIKRPTTLSIYWSKIDSMKKQGYSVKEIAEKLKLKPKVISGFLYRNKLNGK